MPLGAVPVGMRTWMPLVPSSAGPIGTRMPPVRVDGFGTGVRCQSAPGRSGCGRGCRRCGWTAPALARGHRRRRAVVRAGAESADARRRAGRGADADAGGTVSLRAPVPSPLPLGAGLVGVRTRMPAVRYLCGHRCRVRCRSAPGWSGCGRGCRRWVDGVGFDAGSGAASGAGADAGAGPVADRRRAGRLRTRMPAAGSEPLQNIAEKWPADEFARSRPRAALGHQPHAMRMGHFRDIFFPAPSLRRNGA